MDSSASPRPPLFSATIKIPAVTVLTMLQSIYALSAYIGYKMAGVYADDQLVGITSTKPFMEQYAGMMKAHRIGNSIRCFAGIISLILSLKLIARYMPHTRVAPILYLTHLVVSLFSSFLAYDYLSSVSNLEPIIDRCPWHAENNDDVPKEYKTLENYCLWEWWLLKSVFSYVLVGQVALEICATFLVCAWCRTLRKEERLEAEQKITWAASEGTYLATYSIRLVFFVSAVLFSILTHVVLIDFGMLPQELGVVRSLVAPNVLFVIVNLIGLLLSFRSQVTAFQAKILLGLFWGQFIHSTLNISYQYYYLQFVRLPELQSPLVLLAMNDSEVPLGWEDYKHYAEFFADKTIHLALPFAIVWVWINFGMVLLAQTWAISLVKQANTRNAEEKEAFIVSETEEAKKEGKVVELDSVKVEL
ncbi:hypothetical protein BT69DRAFT_1280315 [Atractiella rhizophila]|nr:hypothetical protein BT69DRAFT_1280315 [Atractiella rhizophila]